MPEVTPQAAAQPLAVEVKQVTSRAPLALGLLIAFAAAKLLLHLLTVAVTPYEIHRDEFLYLAMGQHLHLWRMDFPPMIALLAQAARELFGDNLFAIRFFPALGGTAVVVFTGLIARELGGGRLAQAMAMTTVLVGPLFLRPAALFQPVVLDQLWWTVGFFAVIKILQSPAPRWWGLLGLAGGLGILTKFSIGFFAVGLLTALLLSERRQLFLTRWPYLTGLLALIVGSPSIIGQLRLDFPVVIHMHDLQVHQLQRVTYGEFLMGPVWMLGPAVLLALAGIIHLFRSSTLRPYRAVAWTCVTTFLLLLFLHGKPYYIGPIYPTLIAAGAVALSALSPHAARAANIVVLTLILLWAIIGIPFGLPLVPPPQMARLAAAVGIKAAVTTNRGTSLPLPQDFADMLGWEQQVQAVARVYAALPPEKRDRGVLIARNYGEAGALEFYGPRHGLPSRICLPDNYLLWPPTAQPADVVVTLGIPPEDLARFFRTVPVVSHFDYSWMVEEERHVPICVAETLTRDLRDAWPRLKAK
jgi:4-amino-4-deoxy-L-arabinose transferase-like glycosyltransferase